jgi:hypothetical protein
MTKYQNNWNNTLVGANIAVQIGSDTTGDIYYLNSNGYLARLPIGSAGQALVVSSGLPAWVTGPSPGGAAGGDLTGTYPSPTIASNAVTYAKMQNTSVGTVFLGNSSGSAGAIAEIPVSTAKTMLGLGTAAYVNTGTTSGCVPVLGAGGLLPNAVIPSIAINATYVVANSTARLALTANVGDVAKQTDTGVAYILQAAPATTDSNWIQLSDTTMDASFITTGTIGTARLGSGTANSSSYLRGDQTWQTLPYIPMPTVNVTAATQAMAINTNYVQAYSGACAFTLPVTAAQGSMIRVIGTNGSWSIGQNAGQQINFGKVATTAGTGGSISSSNQYDCVTLFCTVANTNWQVIDSFGNIAYV